MTEKDVWPDHFPGETSPGYIAMLRIQGVSHKKKGAVSKEKQPLISITVHIADQATPPLFLASASSQKW